MPDVVIWMMSGEKRIAYHRIPAYDLLYSPHGAGRGKHCGQVLDLFMQVKLTGNHFKFNPAKENKICREKVWLQRTCLQFS